jgi:hypothetical protein
VRSHLLRRDQTPQVAVGLLRNSIRRHGKDRVRYRAARRLSREQTAYGVSGSTCRAFPFAATSTMASRLANPLRGVSCWRFQMPDTKTFTRRCERESFEPRFGCAQRRAALSD